MEKDLLLECGLAALYGTGRSSEIWQRFPGAERMDRRHIRKPHQLARAVRKVGLETDALELVASLLDRRVARDRVYLADWAEWLHRFVPRSGHPIDRDYRSNCYKTSNRPVALAG